MSTEFRIFPTPGRDPEAAELTLLESSGCFTLTAYRERDENGDSPETTIGRRVPASDIIAAALRMLRAAMYHVDDPKGEKARIVAAIKEMG